MLSIGTSTIEGAGKGVFATEWIQRGSVLGEYSGYKMPMHADLLKSEKDYAFDIVEEREVLVPYKTCIFRYINDTISMWQCIAYNDVVRMSGLEHNVDWHIQDGRVFIVATHDIAAGDELFIHYGNVYWRSRLKEMVSQSLKREVVEHHRGDLGEFLLNRKRDMCELYEMGCSYWKHK